MNSDIYHVADFKKSILNQPHNKQIIKLEIPLALSKHNFIQTSSAINSAAILLGAWRYNISDIWNDLTEGAMQEIGRPLDIALRPILRMILEAASTRGLPFPVLTLNDDGGFEAFFKKCDHGLMLSVGSDLSLEAYGDYNGEIWRAKIDRSMPRSKPVNFDQISWLMSRY